MERKEWNQKSGMRGLETVEWSEERRQKSGVRGLRREEGREERRERSAREELPQDPQPPQPEGVQDTG